MAECFVVRGMIPKNSKFSFQEFKERTANGIGSYCFLPAGLYYVGMHTCVNTNNIM